MRTYNNNQKIASGQGDGYRTGCLLDYSYFQKFYKIIEKDLNQQQALDASPEATHQGDFTGNLYQTAMSHLLKVQPAV